MRPYTNQADIERGINIKLRVLIRKGGMKENKKKIRIKKITVVLPAKMDQ